MELNLDIRCGDWQAVGAAQQQITAAAAAALAAAGIDGHDVEVTVVLADDDFVADLNQRWRGKTGPTNVLSFPVADDFARAVGEPKFIGDIALAAGVVTRQAHDAGKPLATHLSHLVVHGVLHLVGFDHHDDAAAERMQALETLAMTALGLPDPYMEQETAAAG